MLHRVPIRRSEDLLEEKIPRCVHGIKHAPCVSLNTETRADLAEDRGLFVYAEVDEGEFLELDCGAEARGAGANYGDT
jgi:hypothetical protein